MQAYFVNERADNRNFYIFTHTKYNPVNYKNLKLTALIYAVALITVCSCNEPEKKISSIDVTESYITDTLKSTASWSRDLEQGKTKTQIRIFGGLADVTIDGLSLTSEGDIDIVRGDLLKFNDTLINGNIIFDFTSFSLNTDRRLKEEDLFKVKEYPESRYEIKKIVPDSAGYELTGNLTIADVSNEVKSNARFTQNNDSVIEMNSDFEIQTLDWPLRDEKNAKSVIKDVITVHLKVFFNKESVQRDTTFITE